MSWKLLILNRWRWITKNQSVCRPSCLPRYIYGSCLRRRRRALI